MLNTNEISSISLVLRLLLAVSLLLAQSAGLAHALDHAHELDANVCSYCLLTHSPSAGAIPNVEVTLAGLCAITPLDQQGAERVLSPLLTGHRTRAPPLF